MGVNITTIDYLRLRVLTIEIGSTIILMVVGSPGLNFHVPNIFRFSLYIWIIFGTRGPSLPDIGLPGSNRFQIYRELEDEGVHNLSAFTLYSDAGGSFAPYDNSLQHSDLRFSRRYFLEILEAYTTPPPRMSKRRDILPFLGCPFLEKHDICVKNCFLSTVCGEVNPCFFLKIRLGRTNLKVLHWEEALESLLR